MAERMRITKRAVDALRAQDRTFTVWDLDLHGFGLKISPLGRRSYVFRYRVGGGRGGRSREPVIGTHGKLTPDEARTIAQRWSRIVAEGGDPAGARAEQRSAPTMADLFTRYLRDHARPHKKATSVKVDEQHIRNRLLPAFGRRKVAEVTRGDIDRFHKVVGSEVPYLANRCLALLGKCFALAELWGWRAEGSNPARRISKFTEKPRKRFLSPEEQVSLGKALRDAEAGALGAISPYVVAALRVIALTGARKGEVLGLQWKWIDWDAGRADLPDSKTGEKSLPLGAPVLELLRVIPPRQEADGSTNPHIFAGEVTGAPLANIDRGWRVIRAAAKLGDVHIHDLRHSFASVGASEGMSLPMIGALLGHSQPSTTWRYAHLSNDPVRSAADRISAALAAAHSTDCDEEIRPPS